MVGIRRQRKLNAVDLCVCLSSSGLSCGQDIETESERVHLVIPLCISAKQNGVREYVASEFIPLANDLGEICLTDQRLGGWRLGVSLATAFLPTLYSLLSGDEKSCRGVSRTKTTKPKGKGYWLCVRRFGYLWIPSKYHASTRGQNLQY